MPALLPVAHRGFRPRHIAGLVADWNPAALSLNDGDAISSLTDTQGGYHATGTTTQCPTFKTNILNGYPVARFNGTANGLGSPNIDLTGTGAVTVFVVASSASAATDQIMLECSTNTNSSTTGGYIYKYITSGLVETACRGNAGFSTWKGERALSSAALVMSATWDKSFVWPQRPIANASSYNEAMLYMGGLQAAGSNAATNTANNANTWGNVAWFIGARNKASLFFNGDVARVLLYNRKLSHAERAQVEKHLTTRYGLAQAGGTLACVGDSMTAGANATNPYPSQLAATLTASWNWGNYGMSGWQLSDMTTYGMTDAATPYVGFDGGKSVAVLWGGTNDMAGGVGNQSAATAYTRLQTTAGVLRSAGYKVLILNCLPRSDTNAGVNFSTRRASYNSSIAAGWSLFADGLVDVAAISGIGADGDSDVTTYYTTDKVHLNNTGLGLVVAAVKTAVEALP